MKKLAYGISVIYHPLLMPSLLMVVMLWWAPTLMGELPSATRWILLGLIALLTFVLPMVNIILLKITRNISSMDMSNRNERIIPLILTSIYYGFSTYLLTFQYRVSTSIVALLVGVFVTLILVTLITFFNKISIHAAGSWGGVGLFMAIIYKTSSMELLLPLVISILLAGTVSSARLYLGAHRPFDILQGAIVGFIACFVSIYLLL